MPDPDDAGLTELLQRPAISIADEDQAFGAIVARARTRVRRRRLTFVGLSLLLVTLVGSTIGTTHRADDPVAVQTTPPLSAADVTFAVFARPATPADAGSGIPTNHGGFFYG